MSESRYKKHYKPFHAFDDLFLKKTVMPLVASHERSLTAFTQYVTVSIPRKYTLPINLESDGELWMLHDMLNCLAQKIEHDLSVALSNSVLQLNKGCAAGWYSRCYDLGTPDRPVIIDDKTALPAITGLTNCAKEIPSFDCRGCVFVPEFMLEFILNELELKFPVANFPCQSLIRPHTREAGSIDGFSLFTDRDVTNERVAYAFHKGAVAWNFRFYIGDSQIVDNVSLLFTYCIVILHPEQVVRMIVTKGAAL